jgi:hypothetical protein
MIVDDGGEATCDTEVLATEQMSFGDAATPC